MAITAVTADPSKPENVVYYSPAGAVLCKFHASEAFVRGIRGPIGSGKSTACCIEILARSAEQKPGPDGIRHTRWAVIRNSYGELRSTTLKTWSDWCPTLFGRFSMEQPITHHIRDGEIDMEVLFIALDRDEDIRKLLSLELTGAWINEAREIPKSIVDTLTGRVGRFPAMKDGGCTWSGILLDTNPPDQESWWYKVAEDTKPEGWEFFGQPSALSAQAENLPNLQPNYYQRVASGKDDDWVRVYVHGDYGFVMDGKPVYPMFRDGVHIAKEAIKPVQGLPLYLGADFGLTPAAIVGQRLSDGRWLIIDEMTSTDTGVLRFADLLRSYVLLTYPGYEARGWADPAGAMRSQTDERTCLQLMNANTPWQWNSAPGNDLTIRLEAVRGALNRLVDGKPGILISPKCAVLRRGFNGGYHFKAVRTGGNQQYHDTPAKNEFSHPHDALQYLLSGAGEARVIKRRRFDEIDDDPRPAFATMGERSEFG